MRLRLCCKFLYFEFSPPAAAVMSLHGVRVVYPRAKNAAILIGNLLKSYTPIENMRCSNESAIFPPLPPFPCDFNWYGSHFIDDIDSVVMMSPPHILAINYSDYYLAHSEDKGWGVFCQSKQSVIPPHTMLFPYFGEYIGSLETQRRQLDYDSRTPPVNYVITCREHCWSTDSNNNRDTGAPRTGIPIVLRSNVDATNCGNVARFVNHSCAPNCALQVCRRPGALLGVPVLVTRCTVHRGEELTFSYCAVHGATETESGSGNCKRKASDMEDESTSAGTGAGTYTDTDAHLNRRRCHCGSEYCTGFLATGAG